VGVDAAIGSAHGDAGQAARSPVGEDGISTAPGDTQGFRVALDAGPATGERGNARPNFPAEGYLPWLRRRIRCANYLTVPKDLARIVKDLALTCIERVMPSET
jgi:hypothetical protein